jgi:DNA-binding MarR family transcriptional regulator
VRTPSTGTLEVWTALLLAHRHLTAALDEELRAGAGITLDDYDVLLQVRRASPLRLATLAERVLVSRPTASRVAERAVQRGWLTRTPDPTDRRAVHLQLTPEGRRVQARAARIHLDGLARLVGDPLDGRASPSERAALAGALHALAGEPP